MDPVVLFFLLGVFAKLAKSDLRLPEALYETLSIFLLLAIGLKGGVELAKVPFADVAVQAASVLAMGFLLPLPAFAILRGLGRLPRPDAASIAAHYGSVSVVTFAVATAYLAKNNIEFEAHMPLFVALLETPAIVTGILLVKVVPQFAETFSSFGAELPVFTQFVMKISDFAIKWWLYVLGGVGIAGYSFGEAKMRSKKFAEGVERLSLKLPVIGEILEKSALARFTRTLSTTFAAGVPLPEALVSCAGATGNVVYRNALMKVRDDVTSGLQLTYSLRAGQIFPIMILQMVSIGEESGALDAMLDKCATFYEAEVDNAVDGLTSMMEPLIMAVLGVLVGGLMIAMYMPIFQIGSVV